MTEQTKKVEVEVTNTEVFHLTVEVPADATEEEICEASEEMWTQMGQEEQSNYFMENPSRIHKVIG